MNTETLEYNIEKYQKVIKSGKSAIASLHKVVMFLDKNKVNLLPELLVKPFNKVQDIYLNNLRGTYSIFLHPGIFFHRHAFLGDNALLKHLSLSKNNRSKELTVINGTFSGAPIGIVYRNWNDEDSSQFDIIDNKLICRYNGHYQKHVLQYFIMYLKIVLLTIKLYLKDTKKALDKEKASLQVINQKYDVIHNGKYSWNNIFHNK